MFVLFGGMRGINKSPKADHIVRNPKDEVCPFCKGIKPWDCEECDSCYEKKREIESENVSNQIRG